MTPEGRARHIAYLKEKHPRFARQAVPRRTPRPDGYASQDDFLVDAGQTLMTFLSVIESQQAAWTFARLLACGVPTFYLSPALLDQLADSDVPADLTVADLFWPHPALCFFLPLKESLAIIGRAVPYLLMTTMKTGDLSTLRNELLTRNIEVPKLPGRGRPEHDVDLMVGCFSTASGEVYSWANEKTDPLNQLPTPMRYNHDSKLFILPSGEVTRIDPTEASKPKEDDAAVLTRARHVALITQLAMTARPDLLTQARLVRPAHTRRKGGELRAYDDLWSPNFLRAPVQRSAPPGDGTHASPRFHRRRAHFSKYHVGPGRAQSIVKWVEATWVGLKDKPKEDAP